MKLDLSNIQFSKPDKQRGVKLPNYLSNDLAYICGVLAGDGHISKDYGGKCRNLIYCGGNPRDEVEFYDKTICSLFYKIFNIKLNPKHFSDGCYGIKFESKGLVEFFTKIFGFSRGKKYKKLRIPLLILKKEKLTKQFISGLFDTDFGFCIKNKNNYPV